MYTMQLAPWANYLQLVGKWVGPMMSKGQLSRVGNSWVPFTSVLLFGHALQQPHKHIPTCMSTLLLLMQ